jgi:RNA polymerase primary sigma factor
MLGHVATAADAMPAILTDLKSPEKNRNKGGSTGDTYFDQAGKYALLTAEQEIECSRKIQAMTKLLKEKDSSSFCIREKAIIRAGRKAKEQMVSANLRLVIYLAKRHPAYAICKSNTSGMELIDLIQEGNIGLAKAADKFEGERGYRFSTYAFWWIKQAMNRSFASSQRCIRLPLHIHELNMKIRKADAELRRKLDRKPTKKEIAKHLSLSEKKIDQVLVACMEVKSLDRLMKEDGSSWHEVIEDQSSTCSALDDLSSLKIYSVMQFLPEREQFILNNYYGLNGCKEHTYGEIGGKLGISRERVRQLINKSVQRIQIRIGVEVEKPTKKKSSSKRLAETLESCYS